MCRADVDVQHKINVHVITLCWEGRHIYAGEGGMLPEKGVLPVVQDSFSRKRRSERQASFTQYQWLCHVSTMFSLAAPLPAQYYSVHCMIHLGAASDGKALRPCLSIPND